MLVARVTLLFTGMYKVPYYQVCWEEYQEVKRGREYHGCEEEYNMEKRERGKQYHLPYNIEGVGKKIKWRKEDEHRNFGKENQDLKTWGGEEYQVIGNFIHPCLMVKVAFGTLILLVSDLTAPLEASFHIFTESAWSRELHFVQCTFCTKLMRSREKLSA